MNTVNGMNYTSRSVTDPPKQRPKSRPKSRPTVNSSSEKVVEGIQEFTFDELKKLKGKFDEGIEKEAVTPLEVLGKGNFGEVKKGFMTIDGVKRCVAVKSLKPGENCMQQQGQQQYHVGKNYKDS